MLTPSTAEHAALLDAEPAPYREFIEQMRASVPTWVRAALLRCSGEIGSIGIRELPPADRPNVAPALALLHGSRESLVGELSSALCRVIGAPVSRAPMAGSGAGDLPSLTLIDESQIDEDIEIARIVQAIEAGCEAESRQLTALVCGLRGLRGVDPAAAPLPPLACATALREGLAARVPDAGLRLLLLRHLGPAVGHELRSVFGELAAGLSRQGLRPARFQVRREAVPAARGAADAAAAPGRTSGPGAAGLPDAGRSPDLAAPPGAAALWRLLERARELEPAETVAPDDSSMPALRLMDEPIPAGERRPPSIDGAAAVRLMDQLLLRVEQTLGAGGGARRLLSELREPARRLAEHENGLWTDAGHPWWQFLDRLMSVGSVNEVGADAEAGLVTRSLGLVVERMRQSQPLDRAACQAAADGVQRLAQRELRERHGVLEQQSRTLQREVDHAEVESEVRQQIVLQLRSSAVSSALRRFLVGPWAQAMAKTALAHGPNAPALDERACIVDDLIRATARPGQPASGALRAVLLRQVRQGLEQADLAPERIETELSELEALLRKPPPAERAPDPDPAESLTPDALAVLQANLPTVPVMLQGTEADSTLEAASQRPWLDELEPGALCRLFLLGRWITAQLGWVSPTRNLYVFASRDGGRTHSLTRRMLGKLRNAGLATSVHDGFLLAQAMESLADSGPG